MKDMQDCIKEFRAAKDFYSDKKADSDSAYAEMKQIEKQLIEMMEATDQRTFEVTGVGKATISEKLSVKTPKTLEEKRAFFGWLKENMGQEASDAYMTVNSSTLNSLFKQLSEEYANRSEVLQIDGLEAPTSSTTISFRKA